MKWGAASPFDLVEGGRGGLIRAFLDVTSDVKDLPSNGAAFSSYLMARLVRKADISESSVALISVHVEMDKKPDHVKMWEAGLKSGNGERNGALTTSKTPGPERKASLRRPAWDG